jgi:hypothetical protein
MLMRTFGDVSHRAPGENGLRSTPVIETAIARTMETMAGVSEEVLIPLPPGLAPISAVRSTLLISSIATLTENGYAERYFAALPSKVRDMLRGAIAGSWVPVEVAFAHYAACGTLGLTHESIVRIGKSVGDKVQGTLLGTAVLVAREIGVSPLTVIPQFPRFWSRAFQGGGPFAAKVGPKEVRLEVHKAVLVDLPYFRSSLCGLVMGVLEPFCTRVYVSERSGSRTGSTAIFRLQWV